MHARYYLLPRETIFLGSVHVLDYTPYLHAIFTQIMQGAGLFLTGIWIAATTYHHTQSDRRPYVLGSVAALLASTVLAEAGKRYMIWPHDPAFPSGHETFASSVAASICIRDRRWIPLCAFTCIFLGWVLVAIHAHTPFEITAGFLLGALTTLGIMGLIGRTSPANVPDTAE
jgi:membrane-associated phospholipid phosphatase